jgi:glycosyltransferase involved in cell wall biosynthesis
VESVIVRNVQPAVPESEVQNHRGVPVVLWVGSVKAWKRPEKFIELARHCQDLSAQFVMVGRIVDPQYNKQVEKATAELPNFHYAGFVALPEVGKYFSQAHLFISTSLAEGFANTFIHAWQRGVPVVSLGVDRDGLLKEQGFGFLAENMEQLIGEVHKLVQDPERRRDIGARARAHAQQEYNIETAVDKIESLLSARGVKIPAK